MIRDYVVVLLVVAAIIYSCFYPAAKIDNTPPEQKAENAVMKETPSAVVEKTKPITALSEEAVVDNKKLDFREIRAVDGIANIQWSVQVTNTLRLSREYSIKVTFYDKNETELFSDRTKEMIAAGETVTVVRRVDVSLDKSSKIIFMKAECESL